MESAVESAVIHAAAQVRSKGRGSGQYHVVMGISWYLKNYPP